MALKFDKVKGKPEHGQEVRGEIPKGPPPNVKTTTDRGEGKPPAKKKAAPKAKAKAETPDEKPEEKEE